MVQNPRVERAGAFGSMQNRRASNFDAQRNFCEHFYETPRLRRGRRLALRSSRSETLDKKPSLKRGFEALGLNPH
jgi:hypothetical protein